MKTKVIPKSEWDFRSVDDRVLRDATLYEYARESKKLRDSICAWLSTKFDGRTVREHYIAELRRGRRRPSLDIVPFDKALRAIPNSEIIDVIERMPDFPEPWVSTPIAFLNLPAPLIPYAGRMLLSPLSNHLELYLELAKKGGDPMQLLENAVRRCEAHPISNYNLSITWGGDHGEGVTINELVEDFRKWIAFEVKKQKIKLRRGKASQAQVEPLKWLAAYRLNRAGHTYESAYRLLEPNNDGARLIPLYSDKSGWSDAIRQAKAQLAVMEKPDS